MVVSNPYATGAPVAPWNGAVSLISSEWSENTSKTALARSGLSSNKMGKAALK
jgi:hypothetical protein